MKRSLIYIMIFISSLLLTCSADLNNPNTVSNDNNAYLRKLIISQGELNPVFDRRTLEYTVTAGSEITSITVTPTSERTYAAIAVNEIAVQSGAESGDITLGIGTNIVAITVTAPDKKNTITYTVRFLNTNPDLSGLTISSGTLYPEFDADTTSYFIGCANNTASLTLSPVTVHENAVIIITPSSPVSLHVGPNNISIQITAEDGVTTRTYTIEAYRAVGIPKTGQITSYDTGDEDDGALQKGIAWPGTRFADNGNTITDNLTGLMWSEDANIMPSRDPVYDADGMVTWQNALNYIDKLNDESYLGCTDWRLPNLNELRSLIDYSKSGPALISGHPFTNVQTGSYYWSSTTKNADSYYGNAFCVLMNDGVIMNSGKTGSYYVWPVRSDAAGTINLTPTGQTGCWDESGTARPCAGTGEDGEYQTGVDLPAVRLIDNGDGTFYDSLTGLMWIQDLNLPGDGEGYSRFWQGALDWVTGMNSGANENFGYTDWRLPNVNEIQSLVDTGETRPAFPHDITYYDPPFNWMRRHWLSTTEANNTARAWCIDMADGSLTDGGDKATSSNLVWAVRGGD